MHLSEIINKAEDLKANFSFDTKIIRNNKILEDFYSRFPIYSLSQLTLNNYVRNGTRDTFTYWIEVGTKSIANISGSPGGSAMFQIWSNSDKFNNGIYFIKEKRFNKEINRNEAELYFMQIKSNLLNIINFAEVYDFKNIDAIHMFWKIFKMKMVYLYFPEMFTSVMKEEDIKDFSEIFGVKFNDNNPVYSNYLLKKEINSIAYFKGWTSYMLGSLYYEKLKVIQGRSRFVNDLDYTIDTNDINEPFDLKEQEEIIDILTIEKSKEQILNDLQNYKPNDPEIVTVNGRRFKRDNKIIAELKILRDFKCQICGKNILKNNGKLYVEAAHIISKRDGGNESPENILILCPNHHKEFDLGNRIQISKNSDYFEFELNNKKYKIDISLQKEAIPFS